MTQSRYSGKLWGIDFNDKNSFDDFDLVIINKELSPPPKLKIKQSVPFMQGSYDFSLINGEQTYEERELIYNFHLEETSKEMLNIKKIQLLDWLMNTNGKLKLFDESIVGYYFIAECEEVKFNEKDFHSILATKFSAYPFKISESDEGDPYWDPINFLTDTMQRLQYTVINSLQINIINQSVISIAPKITSSTNMQIKMRNITLNVIAGTNKDSRFLLLPGTNELEIIGTGSISFSFFREVL